jgi:GAF domain-containing protein
MTRVISHQQAADGGQLSVADATARDTDDVAATAAGPSDPENAGSLAQIYDLLIATDGFEAFLHELATLASQTLGGDLSCGITMLRDGRYVTAASSDGRATALDETQYDAGYGPCLHALETNEEMLIADADEEGRWPLYLGRARAQGLRSSISLPIVVDDKAVGALNIYRFDPEPLGQPDQEAARRFVDEARRALTLALRQARQLELNTDLQAAMTSRRVIDQAMGVIMAQNRCSPEEAFTLLRRASQSRNVKLREVAAGVVSSVSGHAASEDTDFRTR